MNATGEEKQMMNFGYQLPVKVFQFITIVTAFLGFAGNFFAYLTASSFTKKSSGQTFIKCLAVSDTIAAFQDGIMEAMLAFLGVSFFTLHPLLCRFLGWFTYFSSSAAGYVLLAAAFDRLIAIWKPIWYKQKSKPKRAIIASLAIWIVLGLSMLPIFFEYGLDENYCNFDDTNPWHFLHDWTFSVYYEFIFIGGYILPGLSMVFVNALIIYKLRHKSTSVSRKDREMTLCLIIVCVSFLICLSGLGIMARLSLVFADSKPSEANLINYVRKLPAVLNNSMNFYAYFAASSYFRNTFFRILRGTKTDHRNTTTAITNRQRQPKNARN
ncbi:somatostatin receptor type 1-like [Symsagittifera roscoffensis]|uniref:somatostatin receptor type 1-like n=1 Tax=Symsagittifera roscoffensis TaxID=84072 RepID=UPI00307BCF4F